MFAKKGKCLRCGESVNKDWNYCPFCGSPLREEYQREEKFEEFFGLSEFDKLIERELKEMDKLFKMDFKFPTIKFSGDGKFSGVSITIHSGTGIKPKIEVKTYGEMKKYEPEIKRRLGIKESVEEISEVKESYEPPKITEEPESRITNLGDRIVIEISLPDVKNEENIKIIPLEQSLEIRARSKDKLYFKLLPLTGKIVRKELKDGKLIIELEKE